jgi:hypothetical protein
MTNEQMLSRVNDPSLQVIFANDLAEQFIDNGYELNTINILDMLASTGLMLLPNVEKNVASEAFVSLLSNQSN